MGIVRSVALLLGALLVAGTVQAKGVTKRQAEMCRWGSEIAREAQSAKLIGRTLYSTRKQIQARQYPEAWMRKMAIGITEQTFRSDSRIKPVAVRQTYYEGCVKHQLAHR